MTAPLRTPLALLLATALLGSACGDDDGTVDDAGPLDAGRSPPRTGPSVVPSV